MSEMDKLVITHLTGQWQEQKITWCNRVGNLDVVEVSNEGMGAVCTHLSTAAKPALLPLFCAGVRAHGVRRMVAMEAVARVGP